MLQVHNELGLLIHNIQSQESDLETEIKIANDNISQLQKQIEADRQAIIKAKEQKETGKYETIFGIIFAPFTGGLSLILAGIGVASISEAEGKISTMQATINEYQRKISSSLQSLTEDQAKIASLQSITLTTSLLLSDIDTIESTIDNLRVYWMSFEKSLDDIIDKVNKADKLDNLILCKAWFEAACNEWELITPHSVALQSIGRS